MHLSSSTPLDRHISFRPPSRHDAHPHACKRTERRYSATTRYIAGIYGVGVGALPYISVMPKTRIFLCLQERDLHCFTWLASYPPCKSHLPPCRFGKVFVSLLHGVLEKIHSYEHEFMNTRTQHCNYAANADHFLAYIPSCL